MPNESAQLRQESDKESSLFASNLLEDKLSQSLAKHEQEKEENSSPLTSMSPYLSPMLKSRYKKSEEFFLYPIEQNQQ